MQLAKMRENDEQFTHTDLPKADDVIIKPASVPPPPGPPQPKVSKRAIITTCVLVYINLLNYMDRFTVSSVLPKITTWFDIHQKMAGLLQTIFVCSYMVFAPIFGYLGDRYSRKYVMAIGITIWTITTFAGSLMDRDQFWGFFVLRGLVGIGEASYSTVAPTIIADLFIGGQRSRALSIFYFAIPCGSGLGYVVGSQFSVVMGGEWQWALRVTPVLGIVAVLLTLFAVHEPKRGVIEVIKEPRALDDLSESVVADHPSSFLDDLRLIVQVRSFMWATAGFTCVSFIVGALAWWAPEFALASIHVEEGNKKETIDDVSYIFGIVTFIGGVVGVWLGAEVARRWKRTNQSADPLVCAYGIISAIPFLFFALYVADKQVYVMWGLILVGEILMCMNWAPNGDLLLYVIPPRCRSSAEAVQILIIHVLGDAFSPFVVGAISDAYTKGDPSEATKQHGLLYSLYMTPFICVFGAVCYFVCARYIVEDKQKADGEVKASIIPPPTLACLEYLPGEASGYDPDAVVNDGDEENLIDNEQLPHKTPVTA